MTVCAKAVNIFKQIWKQTPQGKFPPEQAHACFTLYAELLRRDGRFQDAERSCKSLVKLEQKFCGKDHLMTADAFFMLGRIQLELV
jgi:threonine synthase